MKLPKGWIFWAFIATIAVAQFVPKATPQARAVATPAPTPSVLSLPEGPLAYRANLLTVRDWTIKRRGDTWVVRILIKNSNPKPLDRLRAGIGLKDMFGDVGWGRYFDEYWVRPPIKSGSSRWITRTARMRRDVPEARDVDHFLRTRTQPRFVLTVYDPLAGK